MLCEVDADAPWDAVRRQVSRGGGYGDGANAPAETTSFAIVPNKVCESLVSRAPRRKVV